MPGVDATYLRGDREFVDLDIKTGITTSALGVRSGKEAHTSVLEAASGNKGRNRVAGGTGRAWYRSAVRMRTIAIGFSIGCLLGSRKQHDYRRDAGPGVHSPDELN